MAVIDCVIVLVYLIGMVLIGLYFQRKASGNIDSYFLGDRGIPWWALGASGMSSNLDISGTMINVALVYALGMSGFFIEIRGGVTLIMAFLMIFMGKWNRRAQVMTLAEWMHLRFGQRRDGDIARLIAAGSIIVVTIAMITYFAIGSGKFIGEFLEIPAFWGLPPEFWAATLMIVLAMIYTVASGLYGVVWTDVFQGAIIFGTIIIITFIAFTKYALPETFQVSLPLRDGGFIAHEWTRGDWLSAIPHWKLNLPAESTYSMFNFIGIAIIFYLIKVVIEGSGGTSGYMIQRYFAAKNDREAGLLSLFWTFLLSFRWPFIAAIALMGIGYGAQNVIISDPEKVLPFVINEMVPIGVKGFLVAGLMAAAMSTFDSTVNAGAAYWVRDIYQAYINPKASEKTLMSHSRWASVIIVIIGLVFSLFVKNINEIWGWITMSIGAGMIVPMLVRWYWWRFNGYGFAWGIASGMITAILQRIFMPEIPEYWSFTLASGVSLIGLIAGTLLTQPSSNEVLANFYKTTRPFGFWGPVRARMSSTELDEIHTENRRDISAIFFAVPWQVILFMGWMMFIFRSWTQFGVLMIMLVILSVILYYKWFRHLEK